MLGLSILRELFMESSVLHKMQPRINDYFKQVHKHLSEAGVVDLTSPHPSLRKHDIRSDFRIVHIDRRFARQVDLPFLEKITIILYYLFKRFGICDVHAWSLDTSIVNEETIPLTIPGKSRVIEIIPRS